MKKKQFIRKEVAEILQTRPSQAQYYTDTGMIPPDISAPKGRRTRRVYSERNLIEILIAKRDFVQQDGNCSDVIFFSLSK